MSSDLQIFEKINDYIVNEESFAFALVIDTWKSAPKPVGSILLVSENGEISRSVSGGCLEGAVISEAHISLKTKKSKIFRCSYYRWGRRCYKGCIISNGWWNFIKLY